MTSSLDPEAVRFEYNHLRQELIHNGTLTIQILGGSLLVAGTLMTVGLNDQIPNDGVRAMIFTLAAAVLLLGRTSALDRRMTERIIASYLRFLEKNKDYNLHWETRVARFRNELPKYKYDFFTTYQRLINTLFLLASGVLVLYYAQEEFRKPGPWFSPDVPAGHYIIWGGVAICFLIVVIYSFLSYIQSKKRSDYMKDENFDRIWEKIGNSSL